MKRSVDINKAITGVVAGGAPGGAGVALIWVAGSYLMAGARGANSGFDVGLLVTVMLASWIIATIVFWFGIAGLGLPAWALLHRLGWTGPLQAVFFGGLITFAGSVGLMLAIGGSLSESVGPASLLALDGAVVGWVIQRIAYSPIKPALPPPAPPS